MTNSTPFLTTVVGSMPKRPWLYRPRTVEELEKDYRYGQRGLWTLDGKALDLAKDDVTRLAIRQQEHAGIDVVSDGEQRREHYLTHFTQNIEGFDYSELVEKTIRGGNKAKCGRCIKPILHKEPITVDDLFFLKGETNHPVKVTLPGPMTIVDSTFDEFYHDEKALAGDWALAINKEAKLLDALGPAIIQFDEPAFSRYPKKVKEWGIDMLNVAASGLKAETAVHICYGYPHPEKKDRVITDSYSDIISALDESSIDILALEFEGANLDPSLLSSCPSKKVMFGCVWNSNQTMETPEKVALKLLRAAEILSPEHIMPAPDCGLAPCTSDVAYKKLEVLVAGAKLARKRA